MKSIRGDSVEWDNPDSQWRKLMAYRVRWSPRLILVALLFAGFGVPLILYGFTVVVGLIFPGSDRVSIPGMFYVLCSGLTCLAAIYVLHRLPRDRRALGLVPEHEGWVCPKCVVELPVEPDGDVQPQGASCARCGTSFSREQLILFWEDYPYRLPALLRGFFDTDRTDETNRFVLAVRAIRGRVNVELVLFGVMGMGFWLVSAARAPGQFLVNAAQQYYIVLVMLAFGLLFMGGRRRVGDELHCIRCGYQKDPASAGERCPECGLEWTHTGTLRRGQRRRSPKIIALGALLFLLAFLLPLLTTVTRNTPGYALIPTDVLLAHVLDDGVGMAHREWSVLLGRALTPEQHETIVEILLEKYRVQGWLMRAERIWLRAQITEQRIPPRLREPYALELMTLKNAVLPE